MPTGNAKVSFKDPNGVTHTVTVDGESLYTVAAAAIAAFRRSGVKPGPVLRIEVAAPRRVHELAIKKLEDWLRTPGGRSPPQVMAKRRVAELLDGGLTCR